MQLLLREEVDLSPTICGMGNSFIPAILKATNRWPKSLRTLGTRLTSESKSPSSYLLNKMTSSRAELAMNRLVILKSTFVALEETCEKIGISSCILRIGIAYRTGVIFFLRFSGERRQARVTHASRSPRACRRSPEKRKKITPVLQASCGMVRWLTS